MSAFLNKIMTKFTAFIDPRLAKYRPQPEEVEEDLSDLIPQTKLELIELMRACDRNVLSDNERYLIANSMAFSAKPVSAIMHQKARLTFLYEEEQLDALKLDKLYKTGLGCFPVYEGEPEKEPVTPKRAMSKEQKPEPPKPILGLLRLEKIDALKAAEDKVKDHITPEVCYARADYSCEMLLAALLRAKDNFALVIDRQENIIGYVTLNDLMKNLFGDVAKKESFKEDSSVAAVARRSRR